MLDWHNGTKWNPLADDGDALRLAVKKGVEIATYNATGKSVATIIVAGSPGIVRVEERHRDDPGGWVPVAERMPASGMTVLACYKNSADKWRRIRAKWVAAKSSEASYESDIGEYDEAADCYYDPEGWYEQIDNWPEYTACTVDEGVVTHWMPLPEPPNVGIEPPYSVGSNDGLGPL